LTSVLPSTGASPSLATAKYTSTWEGYMHQEGAHVHSRLL
jgi:hypothetical protein